MTCPMCGEACTCAPDDRLLEGERSADAPSVFNSSMQSVEDSPRPKFVVSPDEAVPEAGFFPESEIQPGHEQRTLEANPSGDGSPVSAEPGKPASPPLEAADSDTWREEVSARLSRYRARRRPRAPRYPSLRLKFEAPPIRTSTASSEDPFASSQPASAPLTCQALAMNPVEEAAPSPSEVIEERAPAIQEPSHLSPPSAKILEFPRWAYAPPVSQNELADPIVEQPRILEVPEVVPPPPAMGGITIEDARPIEPERQPGIDMPLRSAPLGLRVWAALVDGLIVLLAGGVFGSVFYRVTGARPPVWEMIGICAALQCILWAAYQYLFVVFCGTTLGLRAAHLRISRFDGSLVNRRSRRLRVLCSFLSALSLGMGYAWQFLDEDKLCWHERVTRTYLSPST